MNNPPDQRWHIRQWQTAVKPRWAATDTVTAPQRQWPRIALMA
jgi:hypothetical protein